ncbi:MAG: MarR family winged helix-turn-helix transcriptional regulator [Oceanospirillaceae bacterium]
MEDVDTRSATFRPSSQKDSQDTPSQNEQPDIKTLGEVGLSQFAPYLINRVVGLWNSNLQDQLREHNLSTVKMRTLAVLSIVSGLTINELSLYTVLEQSTMSRSLDALEEQGMIRRASSEKDGRVRRIYITDAGRDKFDEYWPTMYKDYQNLFTDVSEEEHKILLVVLQKLIKNIRAYQP